MTDTAAIENPDRTHNNPPDWAKIITDALTEQYKPLLDATAKILADAQNLPKEVTDTDDSSKVSAAVVDMKNMLDRAEANRIDEKAEYLAKERAVDGFFKGIQTRLTKAVDILTARVHNYNERRRIAEEKRRQLELAAAQEAARAAAAKLAAEQAAAAEAAAAAARARKPENIEAHEDRAEQHTEQAESARIETLMAAAAVDEARVATLQKPAELVRERFDDGIQNTMAKVGYVELVDRDLLDLNLLRPHFKDDHLLAALKAYAKATGHKKSMNGAIIEMRAATVIRR